MEGMIAAANGILDKAAKADQNGSSLRNLFQDCKGIILISAIESAVLFSGAAGTGIMMTKDEKTGEWSAPCACGLAAYTYGLSFGAMLKDVIIFAMDDHSVDSFTSKVGLKLSMEGSITLGSLGYHASALFNISERGTRGEMNVHTLKVGGTVTITFCQGAYLQAGFGGAVVGSRDLINKGFYGDDNITSRDILFGQVAMPFHRMTDIEDVYKKLDELCHHHEDKNEKQILLLERQKHGISATEEF